MVCMSQQQHPAPMLWSHEPAAARRVLRPLPLRACARASANLRAAPACDDMRSGWIARIELHHAIWHRSNVRSRKLCSLHFGLHGASYIVLVVGLQFDNKDAIVERRRQKIAGLLCPVSLTRSLSVFP